MSEKIIKIDGKEVAVRCSAATYVLYRMAFKEDLFSGMQKMSEQVQENGGAIPEGAIEIMLKALYIMAKQANKKETKPFEEWLEQFSLMGPVEAVNDVYDLLLNDQETLDEAKKNNDQPSAE